VTTLALSCFCGAICPSNAHTAPAPITSSALASSACLPKFWIQSKSNLIIWAHLLAKLCLSHTERDWNEHTPLLKM
jgi:hypothetical protein